MTDKKTKERVDAYLRSAAAAGYAAGSESLNAPDPQYLNIDLNRGRKTRQNGVYSLKVAAVAAVVTTLTALIMAFTGLDLKVVGVVGAVAFIVFLVVGLVLVVLGTVLAWRERHAYAARKANE